MEPTSNQHDQRLHAYWRMPYIVSQKDSKDSKNPFLNLKEADAEEKLILHKGTDACILLNMYPYNAGHLLVLPYREVADLSDLTTAERNELMDLIIYGKKILSDALSPNGFNIGFNLGKAAGAGIPVHLHGHIVPRWEGDHNFMPVISNTRVLPEALENMWKKLREHCC